MRTMRCRLSSGDIFIPDDWQDQTIYMYKSSSKLDINMVINESIVPKDIDSLEYLNAQYVLMKDNLEEYNEIEVFPYFINEHEFKIINYSWQSPDGLVYQVNLILIVGDSLISITLTSASYIDENTMVTIKKIMNSFVVI